MVAEERITTKFAGLVMAAETEEEASYLASQQVDEARHMQFYAIDDIAAYVWRQPPMYDISIFGRRRVCACRSSE
jgi:hypothetical protein